MKNKIREALDATQPRITAAALARRVGISRQHLINIMNDDSDPTAPIIRRICRELGKTFEQLFGDEPLDMPSIAEQQAAAAGQ